MTAVVNILCILLFTATLSGCALFKKKVDRFQPTLLETPEGSKHLLQPPYRIPALVPVWEPEPVISD